MLLDLILEIYLVCVCNRSQFVEDKNTQILSVQFGRILLDERWHAIQLDARAMSTSDKSGQFFESKLNPLLVAAVLTAFYFRLTYEHKDTFANETRQLTDELNVLDEVA